MDAVVIASILSVVIAIIVAAAFGYKAFKAIYGDKVDD